MIRVCNRSLVIFKIKRILAWKTKVLIFLENISLMVSITCFSIKKLLSLKINLLKHQIEKTTELQNYWVYLIKLHKIFLPQENRRWCIIFMNSNILSSWLVERIFKLFRCCRSSSFQDLLLEKINQICLNLHLW